MASNQTSNYGLSQWEATDAVQRLEFNSDNAKVDAALKSLSDQVVQKANQSALNTVISAVNQKADTATVSSLSQIVAEHTAAITQMGNCQIYTTSYTGTGSDFKTHTFPAPAAAVFIAGLRFLMIALRGNSQAAVLEWGDYHEVNLTWSRENLTISYAGAEGWIGNELGHAYFVVALMDPLES